MACSNCFNGCVQTTSDKCVKYTGVDVTVLGIKNGDSLSYVEQALVTFLVSTLDGTGIKLDIADGDLCTLVNSFLPDCGDLTLADLATALTKSACSLQTQVDGILATLGQAEAPYTIGCLTGVSTGSGTHIILQAVIDLLCTVNANLTALTNNVSTNYVAIEDIDTYIADYIASVGSSTAISSKMIPYVVVEYYGSTNYFNSEGAGFGDWEKIYLCNGKNGTPDKRGRVGVGATTGMGGGVFDAAVDPAIAGNPSYQLNDRAGSNIVTLNVTQIPSHSHTNTATVAITDNHKHKFTDDSNGSTAEIRIDNEITLVPGQPTNEQISADGVGSGRVYYTSPNIGTITAAVTMTNVPTGGGLGHANNQPALACYYIIYIP